MINRSHIRKFLAVVDAGSFTHAAARIRVTQPTLSTGIADLERLVGQPLFLRHRKQVRLTEAGGRFLPVARELERNFRMVDAFGTDNGRHWPDVRLGTIRSVSNETLKMAVSRISEKGFVELIEGSDVELRSAIASGRIQAALTLLRPGEAPKSAISLYSEPYVMLVSTQHRLADREEVHPNELAAEIMIARRSCEILDATSRFFTRQGVRPRFSFKSESDDRCLQMVAANIGITTAPASLRIEGTTAIKVTGYEYTREIGLLLQPDWRGTIEGIEIMEQSIKRR